MVFLQYAAVRQLFLHAFLLHQRHLWPQQLHSHTHRLADREHLCQVLSAAALQIWLDDVFIIINIIIDLFLHVCTFFTNP